MGCASGPPIGPMVGILPHCKARWEQATVEGGHKVVRAAEDAAIREYAESLITPLGAVELVVALKAPKSSFRALSEFFTR